MNAAAHSDDADDRSGEQRQTRRLRFELIFASLWLAFGLFVLPALIFWVGNALMGPYGENAGLNAFYGDFFGDLADTSGRAWTIALGPLLLMYLLRAIFIGVNPKRAENDHFEEEAPPPRRAPAPKQSKEPKQPARRPARVEPRVGRD